MTDRADRGQPSKRIFSQSKCVWGSPVLPTDGRHCRRILGRIWLWTRFACPPARLRNPAFSQLWIACACSQHSVGWSPMGFHPIQRTPFGGQPSQPSSPSTVRSMLTSFQGLDPGKARDQAPTMGSRREYGRCASLVARGAVAVWITPHGGVRNVTCRHLTAGLVADVHGLGDGGSGRAGGGVHRGQGSACDPCFIDKS